MEQHQGQFQASTLQQGIRTGPLSMQHGQSSNQQEFQQPSGHQETMQYGKPPRPMTTLERPAEQVFTSSKPFTGTMPIWGAKPVYD